MVVSTEPFNWLTFDYLLQINGSLKINKFKYSISGFKCKLLLNVSLLLLHKTVRVGYLKFILDEI